MASLREVKDRITSVNSTQQITKAMKMVSAAKLRRAQDSIVQMRPYATKLSLILSNVSSNLEGAMESKYSVVRDVKKLLVITISSNRGLCGAFNTNVMKGAASLVKQKYPLLNAKTDVTYLPIGTKSYDFLSKREFNTIADHKNIFADLSFEAVKKAAEYAMKSFVAEKYDAVEIVFNEFKNVATQVICKEQFLPMISESNTANSVESNTDYILEPSAEYIVKELIPASLKIQLYKAVLESNASEHGARMTAMDKATDNAGELLKELKLTYNRTRQAAITKEILEIVGGAEALAQA